MKSFYSVTFTSWFSPIIILRLVTFTGILRRVMKGYYGIQGTVWRKLNTPRSFDKRPCRSRPGQMRSMRHLFLQLSNRD